MKWTSFASQSPSLDAALDECCGRIRQALGPNQPDLAVLFLTPHFGGDYERAPSAVFQRLGAPALLGCSAIGIIGGGTEVEGAAGVAITAGVLPDVRITPFHVDSDRLPTPDDPPEAWHKVVGVTAKEAPNFLILADPFSIPADAFIAGLDYAFPYSPKVGGLASGANRAGGQVLYAGDRSYHGGAVGIALTGDIVMDTVVAQGCRPVGPVFHVTEAQDNILLKLDGKNPLETVQDMLASLDERDQQLARTALFAGIVMDPLKGDWGPGDFLIRNLVGLDPESGALAIGEVLHEGQALQFHVRDAHTSMEDLDRQLRAYANRTSNVGRAAPNGAFLFSCTGRGVGLYHKPNHDSSMFKEVVGPLPLGGFFCAGEIGPVTGTTYLHGYTSTFGLFRPRNA